MTVEVRVCDDVEDLARAGANYLGELGRERTARGTFAVAFSGGRTPWRMLDHWAAQPVEWARTVVYQVDERVAPTGSDERNLTHLDAALSSRATRIEAMDVTSDDLNDAANTYASRLPIRFDLIHLGLGADGHCASLVPNDPVLDVQDRLVALSGPYQGTRRMTLTYPALARADHVLWLVNGADKRDALAQLLDGDPSIPAGRVDVRHSLVLADRAAMNS